MKKCLGVLAGILMALVFASSGNAEIIAQNLHSTSFYGGVIDNGYYFGTVFKASQNKNLTALTLGVNRLSTANSGNLIIRLKDYTTDQIIASSTNTHSVIDIPADPDTILYSYSPFYDRTWNFANVPLIANKQYRIYVELENATSVFPQNSFGIRYTVDSITDWYSDGWTFRLNQYGFWDHTFEWGSAYYDLYFVIEGTTSPPPPPPAAPLSLRLPFRSGESWYVTQGNSKDCTPPNPDGNTHCIGSSLEFAWDFWKSGALGSDVLAPASGKIVYAYDQCTEESGQSCGEEWGNTVIVDYGNGKFGKLAHLRTVTVKTGQYVFQGEKVGTCGSTGKSTGPHIHYQTQNSSALHGQSINHAIEGNPKFVDSGVLNGVPTEGNWYISSNTVPAAAYHLDTTFDSSTNNNNATSNPSCVVAGCLNLNGTTNYLEAPDSASLSITGNTLSISGWLKTSSSSTQWIVSKYNNSASDASYGLYLSNGYVKFLVSPNGSTGGEVQSTVGITDGNRRHVVVTYDGMELRIYLDGAVNTWQSYVITNIFDSSSPLRIGAKNSQTAMEFFSEMLDEVVIYGRTLTADEANNMYYSSKP